MGRVKELWQQQREEEYERRVNDYVKQGGCCRDEAELWVRDEMEKEDEANSQFGVGA